MRPLFAFTYDDRNRLSALNAGSPTATQATYSYNGKGERVAKLVGTGGQLETATTFVYGEGGQLIGEYTGGNSQEYIYLDGVPVGVVTAIPQTGGGTTNQMYYVETDQLGTPRAVVQPGATTSADTIVWKWDYFGSAFGAHQPSIQTLTVNLRFPGQYFDAETGLNYNYFRDYEPATGRYVEFDPVGLKAGPNGYAYAAGNPIQHIDPIGLASCYYSISSHTMACYPDDPNFIGPPLLLGPDHVFSGRDECKNQVSCEDKENDGPVPRGHYDMNFDNRPDHKDFWRLEPNPKIPGWMCWLGLARCGFEFHPGSRSLGCITTYWRDPNAMRQYQIINELLKRELGNNYLQVTE